MTDNIMAKRKRRKKNRKKNNPPNITHKTKRDRVTRTSLQTEGERI